MQKIGLLVLLLLSVSKGVQSQEVDDWQVIFNGRSYFENEVVMPVSMLYWDEMNFIMTGKNENCERLYFTQDGGNTWSKNYQFVNIHPHKAFINCIGRSANNLFVLYDTVFSYGIVGLMEKKDYKAAILKSTDMGKSWKKFVINNEWRTRKSNSISMLDDSTGIMAQFPTDNETKDLLWITNDGWQTWSQLNTTKDINAVINIKMFTKNDILVKTLSNKVFYTNDGGQSWKSIELPKDFKNTGLNNSLNFETLNKWYFIGFQNLSDTLFHNMFYYTTDLGVTWMPIIDTIESFNIIETYAKYDNNNIIVSGMKVQRTDDGGKTWIRYKLFPNGSPLDLSNIAYFNNELAFGTISLLVLKYTGKSTLDVPVFTQPKINYNLPFEFTINWTPIVGADNYHLQVFERQAPEDPLYRWSLNFDTTLIINDSIITDTYFKIKGTPDKEYGCRISAYNSLHKSSWCNGSFITAKTLFVNQFDNGSDASVYPNPAEEEIVINIETQGNSINDEHVFCISNAIGEIVLKGIVFQGNNSVNISELNRGLYFVRVDGRQLKFIKYK